jgi:hypothetical protein
VAELAEVVRAVVVPRPEAVVEEGAVAVERGAEVALAIWLRTVWLNVPVIPANVNLEENERYGFVGEVGFAKVAEEKRMK